MSSFGKIVATMALLALAAVGLLMSLCGGVFTINSLTTRGMAGFLVISVPSLLAGIVVAWFATRKFVQRVRTPPET